MECTPIFPNAHGDWLALRNEGFQDLLPIDGPQGAIFQFSTKGVVTNRDVWVYGFSRERVLSSVTTLAQAFDESRSGILVEDGKRISWSRSLTARAKRGGYLKPPAEDMLRRGGYRPFTRQWLYYDPALNEVQYRTAVAFPTSKHANVGFTLTGRSSHYDFCLVATDSMPDLHLLDTGQFFPRWRYEGVGGTEGTLFGSQEPVGDLDGFRKVDNITDYALARFRAAYGAVVTKDDVFHYVYGLLHSPDYRARYGTNLQKMLPRIPLVRNPWPFIEAGRKLWEWHLAYESALPFPLEGLDVLNPSGSDPYDFFRVEKMRFPRKGARDAITYNSHITLRGVPDDAYRYQLGARSGVEWVMDRYRVTTDSKSGITNDPNDWSREIGDPRYILDLVARIVTVSVETMKIVDALPELDIREDQAQ